MDVAILAMLTSLIVAFGSAMIALLLYVGKMFENRFNSMDMRIDEHTRKMDCIDRKVVRLATMVGYAHPDMIMRENPLKLHENESIDRSVERYMNGEEDEGGDESR